MNNNGIKRWVTRLSKLNRSVVYKSKQEFMNFCKTLKKGCGHVNGQEQQYMGTEIFIC